MYEKTAIIVILLSLLVLSSFTYSPSYKNVKCLIQMRTYDGEGAYVIVSLINPENKYEKTLYVNGDDEEWYVDIYNWWSFYGKKRTNIDAITGATITGGKQSVCVLEIDENKINKGYKIIFETAVEDEKYYSKDIEFELTSENLKSKKVGSGYISFIRMMDSN